MNFKNKKIMLEKMKELAILGFGSQGICYYNKNTNEVYKIFHQAIDEYEDDDDKINYTKEELMRFSHVKNRTFLWANDIISMDGEIVGYITKYVAAKSLYKTDPLRINLDKFSSCVGSAKKDLKIISENGILTYDLMYNILYGKKFYVTDFDEFSYNDRDPKKLEEINNRNFNYELFQFLVDGYFDEFVSEHKDLNNMYQEKDGNIVYFIKMLKKYLSDYMGTEVKALNQASKCLNKKIKIPCNYQRILNEDYYMDKKRKY